MEEKTVIDLKYKLIESDYLQLNLYYFDIEGSLKKNTQKIILIFLTIVTSLISILIYNKEYLYVFSLALTTFFIVIFHKRFTKRKFEKIFKKNIQQYKNRFGKIVELKITETQIEVNSVAAKTQFYNSQIKSIEETNEYFFIRFQPEVIIIPKRELETFKYINEYLKSLSKKSNIDYNENFDWKW